MKTYEEIKSEVMEVHPCSEKEAAMLYADQFKPKWISVAERLPEIPDQSYLIQVKNKNKPDGIPIVDLASWDGRIWTQYDTWETILYWMPLPAPHTI